MALLLMPLAHDALFAQLDKERPTDLILILRTLVCISTPFAAPASLMMPMTLAMLIVLATLLVPVALVSSLTLILVRVLSV
mmetsp:Transcript_41694/g.109974  ORF Transcript_41694/g.109974 Transcript_41694/m.109974 type:complete len:81 (+) Transcript_41694:426-668(+)|eukprot:CAMPEP_0115850580 /NCGR_PEP_ID=MMETSP0287-20121206/12038_1 /TAXON_ID=412157 /ORGANISM="Chrysochromulina rotalis, Strain UIO044" /LENGTH=80 /DNA_ID=CAMNT_0003304583 /DNA_START=345 /DNA_END=587 /DNA_ORIENTATION=+